jgi:DNA adenine methylase
MTPERKLQPPFPYFGGKTTLAPRIVDLFPAHEHYVEPFAGSLSVLLAKPRSLMETVNDLDGYLMTFWRVLRDRPEELARVCALTPHARAEYEQCRDDLDDAMDELEQARRVWVSLTQGRAGTLRKTGWRYFRDRAGSSIGMPGYLIGYVDRMIAVADRLAGVSLECQPALDVIRAYGQHAGTLIYADPPYLGAARAWEHTNNYRIEMRHQDEHVELAEALHACAGPVVLSGYATDLYDRELYADWDRVEMRVSAGNGIDRDRTEVLWSNRALGAEHLFSGEASA